MSDQDVELRPDRKEVTVASTPVNSSGSSLSEAVTFVGPDSVEITGDGSIKRPKRSGERELVGDWITEEPNSSKLNRYRSETITVSAAENIDREIIIDQLIPACSDGVDNDGDGYADKADTRACTDLEGNYDLEDDNEVLKGFSRTVGVLFEDTVFVSSAENKREVQISPANGPLPWSVTVAKGKIDFAIEAKMDGNGFAMNFHTGESKNSLTIERVSDVATGQDTTENFVLKPVDGINRSFFADGPHWALDAWHDSKAEGKPPGSGDDRVYFYVGDQEYRAHRIEYVYEPEDVPDNKQKSTVRGRASTLESGQCKQISATDEVCRVPAGEVEAF